MRLGIRTPEFLSTTLLTVAVVLAATLVHVGHLASLMVQSAASHAALVAHEVAAVASVAITTRPEQDPVVTLRASAELRALLDAQVAHSSDLVDARIVASGSGTPILASPTHEDVPSGQRRPLASLLSANWLNRLLELHRRDAVHEISAPIDLDGRPFAELRLGIGVASIRGHLADALGRSAELAPVAFALAWVTALLVARGTRRRIHRVSELVDRIRHGEVEARAEDPPRDLEDLAIRLRQLGDEMHSDRLALSGTQASLEQVLDQSRTGTLILDADERIVFQNRRCDSLLGGVLAQTRGRAIDEVLSAGSPLADAVLEAIRTPENRAGRRVSLEGCEEEGGEAVVSVLPAPGRAGAPNGWVVSIESLESLRTLRSVAEYAARMSAMSRLTRGVVHEVKNPLNAMSLHLEVLRRKLPEETLPAVTPHLDVLKREIHALDHMVRSFLEFMRPPELEITQIDLVRVLDDVRALVEPEARERGIELECDFGPESATVLGDDAQLRQAITNLTQNAIEAMPDGGTLTLSSSRGKESRTVEVGVEDSGAGIAPDELDQVAQLYYSTKANGSGLGLAIVHRTVQLHGGSVTIDSEPGRGTRVGLRFPRAPVDDEPVGKPSHGKPPGS